MAHLYAIAVDVWDTKHPGRRDQAWYDEYLLNTNRMVDIIDDASTGYGEFKFHNDPDDRRDSPDTIMADSASVATITDWADFGHPSKFITLPIFPGTDLTETAVDTTIEFDNIAYIWQTDRDYDRDTSHMVYYPEAWKRVECLVDKSLLDIWVYDWLGVWM